ncbi:hypothetical protein BV22DRAFT_634912 [Leucogyrophana mollusca]|uniref:Uncharacterized protein n=1 Tax=Leucogyrophana mollusca TaxID=85980 RepID=A0ACB8BAC7_9AGAM|nr:hypothetical protein BV22DRAFT_634912 [Leucogyrophana mollusca]
MKPTPSFQGSVGSDERSGTWVSRVISTEPSSRASSSRASRALSAPQAASSSLKIVVKPRGRKRKSEFSQTPSASASGSAPPAKRPRGRPRKSAVKIESAAVGLASHHHREEQASCEWPKKPDLSHSFDRQFIQCDNCELWYHYGCVAIGRGDPRLKGGVVFICPPCNVETAKRVTQRKRDDSCARPGCDTLVEEEYIIERILGRKAIGQAGFVWLAKWDGYALSQATWIPEGNIGDEGRLFEHFFADAKSEGIDIDGADPAEVILLEEAREGGLGS